MQVVLILEVIYDVVLVSQSVVVWRTEIICNIVGHNAHFFGQVGYCSTVVFDYATGKGGNFAANRDERLGFKVLEFGESGIYIRFDASIYQVIFAQLNVVILQHIFIDDACDNRMGLW